MSAAPPIMPGFYVLVGSREPLQLGYVWRVWARSTSFYLKPRHSANRFLKISLHGPDPRHRSPGFKLAMDGDTPRADKPTVIATPGFLPCWFPGEEVQPGVRRIARIRTTWDLFGPGVPTAPSAGEVGKGFQGALIDPPPAGYASDLDLFVSERRPFWPNEAEARKKNAALGPLVNTAGEYLTGASIRRSVLAEPAPDSESAMHPASSGDTVRGLHASIDPRGFVWLCEERMSRAALLRASGGTQGLTGPVTHAIRWDVMRFEGPSVPGSSGSA